MPTREEQAAVCAAKWASGTVFRTRKYAQTAASKARRRTGEDIRAYRCGVCGGFYHIGHHLSPEQLRERARRREASGRR